jgi:hypothetical protein
MEILVSTTIFAVVLTMMLVLFNYTLKINRKVEALRQVSQATRNFTEFLAREIRNGTIDYSGSIDSHCLSSYPASNGAIFLALVNRTGDRECFYLLTDANGNGNLWLAKKSITGVSSTEQVNPITTYMDPATFRLFVRPLANPKVSSGGFPGVQPFVSLVMKMTIKLGAADQPLVIPYQTSVSTDDYTIPHH